MDSITKRTASGATTPLRVAIIGGGFSGTLVAVHLLRQNDCVEVDIVEPRLPGRGLAYSTSYADHLLNVPAIRMSAFGSEPLHFLDWLHTHGMPSADPNMFAPRRLYGGYIQDLLETTARSAGPKNRLRLHLTEVTRIGFRSLSARVFLQNGGHLDADKIILATGNLSPRTVAERTRGYFASPWEPEALSNLSPDVDVLLVGAGLTAVDAFLALQSQGHTGCMHMLSRRGKLPEVHTHYRPLSDAFPVEPQIGVRNLVRSIRSAVQTAQQEGIDWRAVIDSIRPVTNQIWQQFSPQDQRRVFRHLKTWWDIHRHRMAPEIGMKVRDALASGKLVVHAGRLRRLIECGTALKTDISLRQGGQTSLPVQRVINCTGPDSDYRMTGNSLIRFLLEKGFASPGATGHGLQTTAQGELVGQDDQPLDWLLTLGPPRLGDLFETTAVPELRKQAEALANHLLSIAREPVEVMPEVFIAAGI